MAEIVNPHDLLFQQVLSSRETAQDFLRSYLPEGDRIMATLAEKWIKDGVEQGMQQGSITTARGRAHRRPCPDAALW